MNQVQPISPQALAQAHAARIPDFVIEAFNELIVEKAGGHKRATFTLDVAIARVLLKASAAGHECTSQSVLANKWMDVEGLFRKAGWKVDYDQPGYNESYTPVYTFDAP